MHQPTGRERKEGLDWGHGTPTVLRLRSDGCRQKPARQQLLTREGVRECEHTCHFARGQITSPGSTGLR